MPSRRARLAPHRVLLTTFAVGWYNVAVIWLMQLIVYPAWAHVPSADFGAMQGRHFWMLFIVVYPQALAATIGSLVLWRRSAGIGPMWILRLAAGLQVSLWVLSAALWGRWQAQIALPPAGKTPATIGPANTHLYLLLARTAGRHRDRLRPADNPGCDGPGDNPPMIVT